MILVTGSDGIVGRELCKQLQSNGISFQPVSHRRKASTLDGAIILDLTSDISLLQSIRGELSAIVHLAAAVPHSPYYPDNQFSANLTKKMDENIFNIQNQINVPLIYMSTCGLYNKTTKKTKTEDDPSQLKITSPYFEAKASGENLFSSEGLSTILRLSAPVGPGLKPNLVLSKFILAAREDGVLEIWGSGKREQDFIDTMDIAKLVLKILDKPKQEILNVCSSKPTSMIDLAQEVVRVLGKGSIKNARKSDPRDAETARYSNAKANKLYGWSPEYRLEESISRIANENFEANL